ncbi:MAG: hypothetical protein ABSC91_02475 [Candidatus Bathyarchaeia archaeon]
MTSKSETSTSIPSPPDAISRPKSRMKIIIASAAIIIIVIAAFLGYWLFLTPRGGNTLWLFKGAYANFYDRESSENIDMTIHEEVLNFNSTYAQILSSIITGAGSIAPNIDNSTTWVNLTKNDYNIFNGNLTWSRDISIYIDTPPRHARNCIAYYYSVSGGTVTVYVDKTVLFPVRFSMVTNITEYSFVGWDLYLMSTNIPNLQ